MLNNKREQVRHYKKYENYCRQGFRAAEKVRKKDLSKLRNRDLVKLYDFLEKKSDLVLGFAMIDLDVLDIYSEEFLRDKIEEKIKKNNIRVSDNNFSEIYRELSTPVYKTFVSEEEEAIARAASTNKNKKEFIEKIYNNFWWVSLGWENIIPRDMAYYDKKIKKYSRKNNLKQIISEIEKRPVIINKKRKEIIKKYGLGKEIENLLKIFDKFAYLHDLRKETHMRIIYSFYLLLVEATNRFKINNENREWYTHKEIKQILEGEKISVKEIKKRKKSVLIITDKSRIKIFSGQKAAKARKKELEQRVENVNELKGAGVTMGKIKARVKVCNGAQEARKKVKKGDILVCGMTLPDYVPAMKIANAIITDEGGITCHAAIISRELGVPCIVGTKIATQVLKDGDLVEVDAKKGVVKIFKKVDNN